ncbi:hypothetical protein B0F87_102158 [Methylobacter tundripaludum]|uniref:Uncharacterized protein n=2 Tax=Methylobacter tundripaludum TaxID=173365 RepID=A0A2S6HHU1_9GAMM|nr:hypothetical protein B0F87_102158 [Methylobacter tundripaludum]
MRWSCMVWIQQSIGNTAGGETNYIDGIPDLTECRFKGWFVKTAAKYLSMQNPAGKKNAAN